ncbi:MAG: hypothetical protein FJ088_00675 [Deltaproteobacteria bacterium]|nr:hypothetical protein [Deltaproteobacteria bacterium]
MPPYGEIQFQHLVLMIGFGILAAILVILARGSEIFNLEKDHSEGSGPAKEFGGGVSEGNRPVPLLIWLIFTGYFIWAAAYVIYSGIYGL